MTDEIIIRLPYEKNVEARVLRRDMKLFVSKAVIQPDDDPPNLEPPRPGQMPPYGYYPDGPVVPPPSTYYPYAQKVSLLMSNNGIVRANGTGPLVYYIPPDDYSILTMLKTSADPLKHGDVVQFQAPPTNPYYGGWLWYNYENPPEPADYVNGDMIYGWGYPETAVITDDRSKFAIYRVDAKDEPIFGPTDIRLLSTNGGFVRRAPLLKNPNNYAFDELAADSGIDADNIFTLVFIPG